MERSVKDILQRSESRSEAQKPDQPVQQQEKERRRQMSPWSEMDRLFDDVFKRPFFSLWAPRMGGGAEVELYPPVDIFEDDESVVVKAEIPGIRKEDINVELTSDSIVVSGHKSSEEKISQKDFFRLERSYGSFSRRFPLPVETIPDRARASFRDGVLEVRIPKSETARERSRRIVVD